MKKILWMLCCGVAAAFVSCKDDGSETPDFRLYEAEVTDVTATTAAVTCRAAFDLETYAGVHAGFVYGPESADIESYAEAVPPPAVSGNSLSGRLTGLNPATDYRVCGFIDLGAERIYGPAVGFRTRSGSGDGPVLVVVGAQTRSVPAAGGDFAIEYTVENPSGDARAEASCEAAWVRSFDNTVSGRIGFTVDANAGAERQTLVTLTYPGAEPCTVRITQLAASGGGPTGDTKFAGWPELPVEVDAADYHYAYHICPDFKVAGHLARNYTVCYSADNHCPVWVAAPRHACYEVKNSDRTDAYGRDPQIPSNIQYSSKATGGGCNKGHMLGSAERLVTTATNRQVFYYTNIAPQLSGSFNTGGGAWNNLESFVDGQVCADTTYIVVGTYFKPFTDAYGKSCSPQTISFGGRKDVTRPSMFYYLILRTKSGSTRKSVRDCSADELKCAAFVLRHNMEKGHRPQAKDLMSVAEIERLTGFRFFTNVPNAPKQTFKASDWGL